MTEQRSMVATDVWMGARKALLDELRQKTAVIDMGMSENDGVDSGGVERKRPIVQLALRLRPLKEPAIDQDSRAGGFDLVAGAGHAARRPVELQQGLHLLFSSPLAP